MDPRYQCMQSCDSFWRFCIFCFSFSSNTLRRCYMIVALTSATPGRCWWNQKPPNHKISKQDLNKQPHSAFCKGQHHNVKEKQRFPRCPKGKLKITKFLNVFIIPAWYRNMKSPDRFTVNTNLLLNAIFFVSAAVKPCQIIMKMCAVKSHGDIVYLVHHRLPFQV